MKKNRENNWNLKKKGKGGERASLTATPILYAEEGKKTPQKKKTS